MEGARSSHFLSSVAPGQFVASWRPVVRVMCLPRALRRSHAPWAVVALPGAPSSPTAGFAVGTFSVVSTLGGYWAVLNQVGWI